MTAHRTPHCVICVVCAWLTSLPAYTLDLPVPLAVEPWQRSGLPHWPCELQTECLGHAPCQPSTSMLWLVTRPKAVDAPSTASIPDYADIMLLLQRAMLLRQTS